ncbi:RNA polymerase sigma factor [Lysinibacillus sp. 54212]|uniref:RNA polymerase sigma factor n=1 Tax=Lysinibacillus sp. 54212 TaxID=3119829 RepID=UPI002FCC1BEB
MYQADQFEKIMDNYTDLLFRIAYYYTQDVQISEDIIQETWIKFYWDRNYQERNELKAYLATIVTNKCKDYLKSWAYRKIVLHKKLSFFNSIKSYDELYESSPLEEEVLLLPLKIKEAIVYFYFEDFSIKEISRILTIPEGTVKSRLRRGKELLKERLTTSEMEMMLYE